MRKLETFKVGDTIVNIHTNQLARVIEVDTNWPITVFEVQYLGHESGKTLRFNNRYAKNWELSE